MRMVLIGLVIPKSPGPAKSFKNLKSMPPAITVSLLKAVQCRRRRHHPTPPFIYCKNQRNLRRMVSRSHLLLLFRNISSAPRRLANCSPRPRGNCFLGGRSPAGRRSMMSAGGGRIQKEVVDGVNGSCKEERRSKLLTLPTVLTLGRVAAVPLLVSTFYMNGWWATTATTSIFIAAAVTDWLDGYLARKMLLGTPFGAFLDPVADKLMVAATLVMLCTRPLDAAIFEGVPWLLTAPSIAIIGREITMSAVREWAASQNSKVLEAVAVNNLGKWKTATQMTALTILLAARDQSLSAQEGLVASGVGLLYISAGLALWSLVVYVQKIWRVLPK